MARNCKDVLSIDDKLYADEEALILSVDAAKTSIAAFIEKNKYINIDAVDTAAVDTAAVNVTAPNLHPSLDLSQSPISIHNQLHNQLHTSLSELSADDLFGELTLNDTDVSSCTTSSQTSPHTTDTPPNIYSARSL